MFKKILCLILFCYMKASIAAIKPHIIKIYNDEQAKVTLSNQDINRIFVEKDKITSFNAPHSRLSAHNDASGSVYLNVYGVTPFTAFFTTKLGRHFSILVMPKSMPGLTYRFHPKTPVNRHYVRHNSSGVRFERAAPYEKTLVHLLRYSMLGEVPPGYTRIAPSGFYAIDILQPRNIAINLKNVTEKVVAGYLGGKLALRVIEVVNHNRKTIQVRDADFYNAGVRAVAISKEQIPKDGQAYVYEVVTND